MNAFADNPARHDAQINLPEVTPIPPRYWWLKRIAIVSTIVVVGTAGLRLWWGWDAEHRLNALIAEYRAAGEPIDPEDFNAPPIPDDENAAILWERAADAIATAQGVSGPLTNLNGRYEIGIIAYNPLLVANNLADVRKIVEANSNALSLARSAAARPTSAWKVDSRSPMLEFILPDLQRHRTLAKHIAVAGLLHHFSDNDRGAVEAIDQIARLADNLDRIPTVISHLVSTSLWAMATNTNENVAYGLRIEPADAAPPGRSQDASREQVRSLIAFLLDDERARRGWKWGMYCERAFQLDTARCLISHRLSVEYLRKGEPERPSLVESAAMFLGHPMIERDLVELFRFTTAAANAAYGNYPDAAAVFASPPMAFAGPKSAVQWYRFAMLPSFSRAMEIHFRTIAYRRMAAVALAIRLFEIDQGSRPTTLDELVPLYLESIPLDPFASDARPIGYAPSAASPVLYSINRDVTDDAGAFGLRADGSVDPDALDLVFFLGGDRPGQRKFTAYGPDSAQAQDDDGEQKHKGGDADHNEQ